MGTYDSQICSTWNICAGHVRGPALRPGRHFTDDAGGFIWREVDSWLVVLCRFGRIQAGGFLEPGAGTWGGPPDMAALAIYQDAGWLTKRHHPATCFILQPGNPNHAMSDESKPARSFPTPEQIAIADHQYNLSIAANKKAQGLEAELEKEAKETKDFKAKDWVLLVQNLSDVMTEVLPLPVEIVKGIVCEQAKLLIGGASKTFKTWFMMDMALSIADGVAFLGRDCLQRKVLYLNLELRDVTFKRRLQDIVHARNLPSYDGQFKHLSLRGLLCGLSSKRLVDKFIQMALHFKSEVIILDPLYKLNTQGKDENSSGELTVFMNELDRLTTEAGCTVLGNDHFSKGNQSEKDPLDAFRGSGVKGGDIDAALILRAHKEKGSYSVDVVHRELPPIDPFVVTWQFPLFHQDDQLDAADMKKPKTGRPKLVEPVVVLYAFEGTSPDAGISISAVSRKIGMARQTLQGHTQVLRARGWIATSGHGSDALQYITPLGIERLELDKKTPPQ